MPMVGTPNKEEHVLEPGEGKSLLRNDRNLVISISYVKRKKIISDEL